MNDCPAAPGPEGWAPAVNVGAARSRQAGAGLTGSGPQPPLRRAAAWPKGRPCWSAPDRRWQSP